LFVEPENIGVENGQGLLEIGVLTKGLV